MGSIVKPPIPVDEAERLEALHSYKILDTPAEWQFDELTRLAALKPPVKVLYMPGYPAEAVDSGRLIASGFSFISKPFTPEMLAQKVRKILDSEG